MPIYEYTCNQCGEESEIMIQSAAKPLCTACGSKDLTRKFSLFAVNSKSSKSSMPGCAPACGGGFQSGSCGSGMCGHKH